MPHLLKSITTSTTSKLLLCILSLTLMVMLPHLSLADSKLPFEIPKTIEELPQTALIETSKGAFEVRFFRQDAPITVANFAHLAKTQFYNDLIFHRYEPNFVLQGGDPEGVGKFGGPGYSLPPEFSHHKHKRGTLGMARIPNARNADRLSNGSQFYITLRNSPQLDGLYTVFAEVVRGMEVVEQLRKGDTIVRVRLPQPVER